jgi:hypothetical protein
MSFMYWVALEQAYIQFAECGVAILLNQIKSVGKERQRGHCIRFVQAPYLKMLHLS